MKKNNQKTKVPAAAVIATLLLAVSGVAHIVLYSSSTYLPLLLLGICQLLPAAANLVLMLLAGKLPKKEKASTPPKNVVLRVLWRIIDFVGLSNIYHAKVAAIMTVLITAGANLWFWRVYGRDSSVYVLNAVLPVVQVVVFVLFIIVDKWCKHTAESADRYAAAVIRNLRTAIGVCRIVLVLSALTMTLQLLGFFDATSWLVIAAAVVIIYLSAFMLITMATRLIRREFSDVPDLSVPMFNMAGEDSGVGVMDYLEENTGMTMRSLWSIKFIKALIPAAIICCALIFWGSTGIVMVEANQQGAVYRLGHLQEQTLGSGLHFTLPWPFDKVEIYDTETVNKVTIGYDSLVIADNLWTEGHNSEEYKLLLGSGNEVVAINLRIEYKIADLRQYLASSAAPESILTAKAYELVTERTINTDLNTILSTDRQAFSASFHEELTKEMEACGSGVCVVGVVLESIHPPVDVADIYQQMISAEIQAQEIILAAQATAEVRKSEAHRQYLKTVNTNKAMKLQKIAAANAEVAEFMASVSADKAYPGNYRYYKYLNALTRAYQNANLILVGDGIDTSNIYFTTTNDYAAE
jgi:regulator of protease activity HflC (stomatin/prohibitin superfamily)